MKTLFQYIKEEFLIEEMRGALTGSGAQGDRHVTQYITPYLPGGEKHDKNGTHVLHKDVEGLEAGTTVRLHSHKKINGKHHVEISKPGSRKKYTVPITKLAKPGEAPKNIGHQYESDFIDRMKKHGLMPKEAQGAGSTAGTDFIITNKKKQRTHKGVVNSEENIYHGETKADTTAAFGQLTIRHDPKKGGWHIPDEARAKRPRYAQAIEDAGILDRMNRHYNPDKHEIPTTASGRAKNVTLQHDDLGPAKAYLLDHHVHVLQVGGGYGTYSVHEEDKDPTGHGLPPISGMGKWTVREKQLGNKRARTVMFQPDGKKGLDRSHINLDDDEHVQSIKKTLGHK